MKIFNIQVFKLTLLFLLLSVCPVFQNVFAAQITASLSRNQVSLDESFQIIFTANETPDDDPDFSPLEQDFSILNQSHTSSSSWINGKASRTIQWRLDVMAKNTGSLIIPPVKFGSDISNTIPVLVTQGTHKGADSNEDLFIEVEATPKNPYVQSQLLYTLRVITRVEIAQARLNEPELTDAVIEKLGEDNNYNTRINGVDYSVTERKYAIFPQKSGPMTIKPLVLTADVLADNRHHGFSSFFNSQITKTRRAESKAIQLDVKPAPTAFTGAHWLSAQQLELKQQWSGDIGQMKVGEPLTRTLTLSAKGTTVGQLPELNTTKTNDSLKAYPDQPVLQEQKMPEGLLALREEKIALIPSQAGSYTLAAIEIPWFNTASQKVEMARIPEITLTAAAITESQPAPSTPQPPAVSAIQPPKTEPAAISETPQQANFWPWLCAFLASGWLLTLVYFVAGKPVPKPAVEHHDNDRREQDTIKALKKACTANDAIAAKDALLEWGRQQFNTTSLGAIAGFCEARLRDEILLLNQVLYGKAADQWHGKKLFQTFTENKARTKLTTREDKSLEPLYRL